MLQSRHVFIDTSIIVSQNYQYSNSVFRKLCSLAEQDKVFVHFTSITIEEVKSHISSDLRKAIHGHNRFKKKARILSNIVLSPFTEIFSNINATEVERILLQQFDNFLADVHADIIDINCIEPNSVFQLYFKNLLPFGENKKKSEFPDAFVLLALEQWSQKTSEKIYVISRDNDILKYAEKSPRLVPIEKLDKFLDVVVRHDAKLASHVVSLLEENEDVIKQAIKNEFQQLGFWLEDQDGDVNEVVVEDIEILERSLLEVKDTCASVHLEVSITFTADVSYDDLSTASYDSEDKVLIVWDKIDKTVEVEKRLDINLEIDFNIDAPEYFKIHRVQIETPDSFGIGIVVEDDGWPYK